TGTLSPCAVLTALRTPTILTSNRGTVSPESALSSLAVWKESGMAAKPRSKTPSTARTLMRMAITISNEAFLPLAREGLRAYTRPGVGSEISSGNGKADRYHERTPAQGHPALHRQHVTAAVAPRRANEPCPYPAEAGKPESDWQHEG